MEEDKPCEDYEQCGVCGYDHEYDAVNQTIANNIRQSHDEEEERKQQAKARQY